MIAFLRRIMRACAHPAQEALSRHLDGEAPPAEHDAVQAHLDRCPRCRRRLGELSQTVRALGELRAEAPTGLADSILAGLRAESTAAAGAPSRSARRRDTPALRVLPGTGRAATGNGALPESPAHDRRGVLRDCLRRPRLRVTLPVALLVGVVLSFINQGATILGGHITVVICATCTLNVLVSFIALNIGLLIAIRLRLPAGSGTLAESGMRSVSRFGKRASPGSVQRF